MRTRGSGRVERVARWPSPRGWRVLLLIGFGAAWSASPSVTGVSGAAHVTPDAQARICSELASAQSRFGHHQSVDEAVAARMRRYGCPGSQPSSTITTLPGTTTTTFHLDCPLPGGGVGPCPTTTTSTIVFPGTTVPQP